MRTGVLRVAFALFLTSTLAESNVRRRRRASVLEVESSSAFLASLWDSDGIRSLEKGEEKAHHHTKSAVSKETSAEGERSQAIERVLMGEARMTTEMSMSFFLMF